jgi:hypothetical protein
LRCRRQSFEGESKEVGDKNGTELMDTTTGLRTLFILISHFLALSFKGLSSTTQCLPWTTFLKSQTQFGELGPGYSYGACCRHEFEWSALLLVRRFGEPHQVSFKGLSSTTQCLPWTTFLKSQTQFARLPWKVSALATAMEIDENWGRGTPMERVVGMNSNEAPFFSWGDFLKSQTQFGRLPWKISALLLILMRFSKSPHEKKGFSRQTPELGLRF